MKYHAEKYIARLKDALDKLDLDTIDKMGKILLQAYQNDKRVFVMGNGGSASTASHFACDFGKGTSCEGKKRFSVISLNDNVAHFTAIANDISYDDIFSEQLKNILQEGDVVMVISASGNSPNVVKALEYAKTKGASTIALVGFSGGKAKELADHHVHVKDPTYGVVEDIHLVLDHMLTEYFKEHIENS